MKRWNVGWLAVFVISASFFPFFLSSYQLAFFYTLLQNICLVLGINLLWGFAGYLNLGYGAFFGLGGYSTAWLLLRGWSMPSSLFFSLLLLLPAATVCGSFLFRLKGLYFSAASLGLLILLEEAAGKATFLTGGHEGLTLSVGQRGAVAYELMLALAASTAVLSSLLDRSKPGFQLRMIREDEALAASVGVPVLGAKVKGYLFGAAVAVLTGGIHVWQAGYISPASAFGLPAAVPPVIMALIGGGRKWWGTIVAALFISLLQEALWTLGGRFVLAAYGLVLIGVGMWWGRSNKWRYLLGQQLK